MILHTLVFSFGDGRTPEGTGRGVVWVNSHPLDLSAT
jgi:hypothetical protein